MTFTEAAIEVLRREGKPLHFRKIAEIAVRDGLLDHVGKVPEDTMADQLAAHCRLPRAERRVIPVQAGTFALTEWGLDEDPLGLENLIEQPDESELPYRSRERHPIPSREIARGAPRAEQPVKGRRREEEERRGRRFPPPAEVAYEILAGAGQSLSLADIAAQGAERLLMPDAFVRDAASLAAALAEDNRRRESAGRRALFQVEGETVTLVAQPEPGERVAVAPRPQLAPTAPADIRKAALAALRRRVRECDGATVEHVAVRLLEKQGFRDVKVAKRGREHVIYTARRRMGLADVRHGLRVVRNGAEATRRDVVELRRDLGHYGAQLGVVISTGEAAREARGEASAAGQLPVVLLCGEAFAEALAEAGVGCVPVIVPDVDEGFFRTAAEAAEKEEAARRARREERDRREGREPREGREGQEGREPREGREGQEGREPREGRREGQEGREPREGRREAQEGREPREGRREGQEGREPREGRREGRRDERGPRAPAEVSVVILEGQRAAASGQGPGSTATPKVVEVSAELIEEEIVSAEMLEVVEDDAEGADEGPEGEDEDGPETGGAAEGAEATGEAGAPGDRRRRRRRRRRRGGRGRGREGAAAAGAAGTAPEGPAGQLPEAPGGQAQPAPSAAALATEAAPEGPPRAAEVPAAERAAEPAPAAPPPPGGDDQGTPGA